MFHVVVCDDEKIFREELTAWLQRYQEENQVSFCIKEFHEGKELADHMPSQMDILFLDIKMKTMDGIKVAETVRALNEGVSIIFLTAVTEYALEGYDVEALHYLLKPVTQERLSGVLDRATQRVQDRERELCLQTPEGIVTNGGRVLGITAKGTDLKEARANAYRATEWVSFDNKYMRSDIGKAIDEA